ncbi:TPA: putative lipid II flippase FtsW [Candidatus Nomurabacteria bacterium]|uniref:Probable peptidoglycan glycosyltransferase FtsW n=2 Tax=Candidatus Nomuraibacteriota TaxID=1752729 RepID=A0A1F6YLZ2_9BACT|nr:MAG: Cell division-specific peptidoglycan biosynthesis regulator FtsW [Parcubacteria group bacterium GW2011_GWC1_42_21]KKT00732.1 MAG: Cell division-specific peptidoglycan biosynthesis regulator FtsW [Candidatus Nomurabacteria bacterium GW2011_GWA1_43_17]KKT07930.1 MAG: Cell division-specific peptidoglycan biosynthesis regulator FtsW [Candidatus Nomurabacteria bacterium GW2011_GWB1_43_19]KKT11891.1 MAG: Cell division-specific peptidoglycan biosynthesis regulator FtsW [Candidatus Nomurabacteri
MKEKKVDKFFLIIVGLLLAVGVAMFISASLGVLAKNEKTFYSILFSQLILGLGLGLVGMYLCLKIDYKFWRKYSFLIFFGSILLTAAVFIPSLGWSHGGAERWIDLGFARFQPVEFLKFGFVIYFAAWLSWVKNKVQDFRFGILPLGIMLAVIALILLKQPDTKNFILIAVTGVSMLFVSGVPIRYILGAGLGLAILLGALVYSTPYLQKRVETFINPSQDAQGASYQIQQSLITLGSGGVFGRGFGQSVQKFSYLPEPQGDSIFAVLGEELGFAGAFVTIFLYILFILRGFRIAGRTPDNFSGLLVYGIVILITAQSFMHIASVTGVFPLTGVPLVFMSQGGTSLMVYLMAVGIVLNISKFQKHI